MLITTHPGIRYAMAWARKWRTMGNPLGVRISRIRARLFLAPLVAARDAERRKYGIGERANARSCPGKTRPGHSPARKSLGGQRGK